MGKLNFCYGQDFDSKKGLSLSFFGSELVVDLAQVLDIQQALCFVLSVTNLHLCGQEKYFSQLDPPFSSSHYNSHLLHSPMGITRLISQGKNLIEDDQLNGRIQNHFTWRIPPIQVQAQKWFIWMKRLKPGLNFYSLSSNILVGNFFARDRILVQDFVNLLQIECINIQLKELIVCKSMSMSVVFFFS